MKRFSTTILSLILLFSCSMSFTSYREELLHSKKVVKDDDERSKQKALLVLFGSGLLLGVSKFVTNSKAFGTLGDMFNLSAGEFQAACMLSTLISGIGLIAHEGIAKPCRSIAWRIPLIAAVGGIVSHNKVNNALSGVPWGIGSWFKENPVSDKKGIFAIYTIGGWYMLKPSLDRIENYFSNKASEIPTPWSDNNGA